MLRWILTAMPVELPWWHAIPLGSAARAALADSTTWRRPIESRQVKGAFADLNRPGSSGVCGQTKMTLLLGFTIAGYNLDRIRSFRTKKRAEAEGKPVRPKCRHGTWKDIVQPPAATNGGTAAPPG